MVCISSCILLRKLPYRRRQLFWLCTGATHTVWRNLLKSPSKTALVMFTSLQWPIEGLFNEYYGPKSWVQWQWNSNQLLQYSYHYATTRLGGILPRPNQTSLWPHADTCFHTRVQRDIINRIKHRSYANSNRYPTIWICLYNVNKLAPQKLTPSIVSVYSSQWKIPLLLKTSIVRIFLTSSLISQLIPRARNCWRFSKRPFQQSSVHYA
jgi:hypothetical protein